MLSLGPSMWQSLTCS